MCTETRCKTVTLTTIPNKVCDLRFILGIQQGGFTMEGGFRIL